MRYCQKCGANVPDDASVCSACGEPQWGNTNADSEGKGFSQLIESEPVQLALKKQKRAVYIAYVVLILLPIVGFLLYGAFSASMDVGRALLIGLVISAIIALTVLGTLLKKKLTKPFVGEVADKKTTLRLSGSRHHSARPRKKYLIWFGCEDGKRRKKVVSLAAYNYLQPGDKVRYLPQFHQPFEKYDKSNEEGTVLCMFCGRSDKIENDTCSFCRNPLIK